MKKIDAHAHLGYIGGWANVGMDVDELISLMDTYEIGFYQFILYYAGYMKIYIEHLSTIGRWMRRTRRLFGAY